MRRATPPPDPAPPNISPATSSKWLIPRLPGFHAAHPAIRVELGELPSTDRILPGAKLSVRILAAPAPAPFRNTRFLDNAIGPALAPAITPAGRADRATRLFLDWLLAEGARMPCAPD